MDINQKPRAERVFVNIGAPTSEHGMIESYRVQPGTDPTRPCVAVSVRLPSGKLVTAFNHTSGGALAVTKRTLAAYGVKSFADDRKDEAGAQIGLKAMIGRMTDLTIQPQEEVVTEASGAQKREPAADAVTLKTTDVAAAKAAEALDAL